MFQYQRGGFLSSIPPVTKNLIIINLGVWLICSLFPSAGQALVRHLGLHFWEGSGANPVQIITYMFLHDPSSVLHVFFNMFTLWMFGRILENVWGSRKFLLFYMVCGVGAALVQEGVWTMSWMHDYVSGIAPLNGLTYDHMESVVERALAMGNPEFVSAVAAYKASMVTIGASGAVFGLLLGFAFVFPNMPLYLFFIPVPIKAKYMVAGYAVLEFFFGISNSMSTVAHFAHLGGLLFGLVFLLLWRKKGALRNTRIW